MEFSNLFSLPPWAYPTPPKPKKKQRKNRRNVAPQPKKRSKKMGRPRIHPVVPKPKKTRRRRSDKQPWKRKRKVGAYDRKSALLGFKPHGPSKYLGVQFEPRTNSWKSVIVHKGKHHYLGRYQKEEDAALAYDWHAKRMRWGVTPTNFPKSKRVFKSTVDKKREKRNFASGQNEYALVGNLVSLVVIQQNGTRNVTYIEKKDWKRARKQVWFIRQKRASKGFHTYIYPLDEEGNRVRKEISLEDYLALPENEIPD